MDKVRFIKLKNNGAFVVRMHISWKSFNRGGDYEPDGYHDICCAAERTIDLADTGIPEGAGVTLIVHIVAGEDVWSQDRFVYDSECGKIAVYRIKGTTMHWNIKLENYK